MEGFRRETRKKGVAKIDMRSDEAVDEDGSDIVG